MYGRRSWLTQMEMEAKFGKEGAMAIIQAKLNDSDLRATQVRDHPDAPGCESMRQYLVLDMDHESDEQEEVVSQLYKAVDDGHHDDG